MFTETSFLDQSEISRRSEQLELDRVILGDSSRPVPRDQSETLGSVSGNRI